MANNEEDIKKYVSAKLHAYKCAKFFDELSMKEKLGFLESCVPYEKNSDFYKVFVNTLLIPNDMYFISQLITTRNHNEISQYYGLPLRVIVAKVLEIKKYELDTLLLNNTIDRDLASQKIKGLTLTSEIDDSLAFFFKEDDYTSRERQENQLIKNKIFQCI